MNIMQNYLMDRDLTDLIDELYGLPRYSAISKIKEFSKRIRQLKVHCLIIEHLYEKSLNDDENALFNDLRAEFIGLAKTKNLSLHDFPNSSKFEKLIQNHNINKFPKFKEE